ncbi:MAG: homoserine kinase type II [Thalassolituus oleivorans]|jgi:homoserine kinase type II
MAVYTSLSESEMSDICERFGLALASFEPIAAGGENSTYLIHARQGSFVLTMAEEKSFAQISKVGRLLAYLNECGFSTTRLLRATSGAEVVEFRGKPVLIKEYIPGETVEGLTHDMLAQVGRAMALLHQIPVPSFASKRGHFGYRAYEVLKKGKAIPEDLSWATDRITRFESLRPAGLPKGLIHADLFYDNLLWENGQLRAFIDFEEAESDDLIFDLAVGIIGMCADGERIAMDKVRALISGYSQVRTLERAEEDLLQAVTEYAAVTVSCWRYWKHTIYAPSPERADSYLTMIRVAEGIQAMPEADWAAVLVVTR